MIYTKGVTIARALSTNLISTHLYHRWCSNKPPYRQFEEVTFKVPWGHIAGKWYGPRNTRPVLGLHGWQDNAGTFDTLAPLLPPEVGFLAIDLPGNGLSSWLPYGRPYHLIDELILLLNLMQDLKWDKLSILSHSMGAIIGFLFCGFFPDKCDMLISLDTLKPLDRSDDSIIKTFAEHMTSFVVNDALNRRKSEPPTYSYDQLIDKLAGLKSIERENCRFILERNTKTIGGENMYYFSRDIRLRSIFFPFFPQGVSLELAKRITCPHLYIRSTKISASENEQSYEDVLNLLKEKPNFEFHQVEGTHHVHLNCPARVAEIINPFIKKHLVEPLHTEERYSASIGKTIDQSE